MRKFRLSTLRRVVLLLFLVLFAAIIYRWISLERWRWQLTRVTGPESEWALPIRPTPSPKKSAGSSFPTTATTSRSGGVASVRAERCPSGWSPQDGLAAAQVAVRGWAVGVGVSAQAAQPAIQRTRVRTEPPSLDESATCRPSFDTADTTNPVGTSIEDRSAPVRLSRT